MQRRHRVRLSAVCHSVVTSIGKFVRTEEVRLLEAGDSYVDRGSEADSWTVGNRASASRFS